MRALESGPRMSLLVDLSQVGGADVSIDLGCRKALVTKQFLNATDIGPAVEKVRREAMTQGVRTGPAIKASGGNVLFQHAPDAACRQNTTEAIDENGCISPERFCLRVTCSSSGVAFDCLDGIGAEGADAFLATFTSNAYQSLVEIEVTVTKSDEFTNAKPSGIHGFENRTVAQPRR